MAEGKDLGKTSIGMDANLAAAISYVFGWLSGLIFFIVEKENKFVRFHAMQSILFSAAWTILVVLLAITVIGPALVSLVFFVFWIILIIKAFSGEEFKLPMIGDMADKYSLDFRLITAIAQQESNLCRIIPPGSHNCWGWGIHSESNLGFSSYEEGIETVSQGLKENYIDEGLTTPDQIMTKYTPSSNGSWAHGVNTFMSVMQ